VTSRVRNATRALATAGSGAARTLGWGRARGPLLASLYLTQRCNLRCVYCSSPQRRVPELSTAQWLRVVDELAALGCRRVALLGGEPLLHEGVPEIIARVRRHGMSCVLTSNGLLVPRQIERLRGLDTLVLSLDAPGPANDEVRGKGVLAAVEKALRAARAVGLPVKLNAVLSTATAPHLPALLAFAEERGVDLTASVVRSGAPDLWKDAVAIKPKDDELRELLLQLANLARRNPRLLFSPWSYRYAARWGDFSQDRLEAVPDGPPDARLRGGPRCHAGRSFVTIDADGSAWPCPLTIGRIRGGSVSAEGVAAACRPLRDHRCLACYSPCLVEQNALFSLRLPVLWHFLRRHLGRYA
jgi:MoaA/NifB/PqqE/SkfB family radical SAM enzyme